jgi:predicted PurR-regulated permease PerM
MNSKYSSPVKVLTRVAVVLFVFGFFLFSNIPIALAAWGNSNDVSKATEKLPTVEEVSKTLKNSQVNTTEAINSTLDDASNIVDANLQKAGNAINNLTEKASNTTDAFKKQVGKTANDVQDKMKK